MEKDICLAWDCSTAVVHSSGNFGLRPDNGFKRFGSEQEALYYAYGMMNSGEIENLIIRKDDGTTEVRGISGMTGDVESFIEGLKKINFFSRGV